MKEISIIAPNIKNGGGRELLEYLLSYIEQEYPHLTVYVYLDSSLANIKTTKNRRVFLLSSTLEKVLLFGRKTNNALYFGNLPPLVKSENSIVYFHNLYLLMSLKNLAKTSVKFFAKYFLHQFYIRCFIRNVDIVACQNEGVKDKFIEKYSFQNVELLPFFRLCDKNLLKVNAKKYDFCYVSLAHRHKNHHRLIEACEILSSENISFSLALTIEDGHEDLIKKIEHVNQRGKVNIVNLGKLPKEEMCTLYTQSKCLVFPSTEETFGLGLVEAVNMDVDVVASDLDYVYQAIEPSLVFDPNSSLDISLKMKKYLYGTVQKSKSKIDNKIGRLVKILTKEGNVQK